MNSLNTMIVGRRRVLMLAVGLPIAAVGCSHFAGGHHGHHGEDGDRSALVLDNGRKWSTDDSLRAGMREIRTLVETSPADPTAAKQIAAGVEDQVAFLIKNCELEPKADAALHVLITDMLTGAETLKEPAPSAAGVEKIRGALEQYPEFFDDPQW